MKTPQQHLSASSAKESRKEREKERERERVERAIESEIENVNEIGKKPQPTEGKS